MECMLMRFLSKFILFNPKDVILPVLVLLGWSLIARIDDFVGLSSGEVVEHLSYSVEGEGRVQISCFQRIIQCQ